MLFAAKSHIGLVRRMNEDSFAIHTDLNPWRLLVIADGMGGASAGEVASRMAAETVSHVISDQGFDTSSEPESILRDAIQTANQLIWEAANQREEYLGMGTTLVATLCDEYQVVIANIGDSRGYIYQNDALRQVTRDHSLVAELVRRGQLTEEEALRHPQRNYVTRSLGTAPYSDPDIEVISWSAGDVLLLCTDGLSNLVPADELEGHLQSVQCAETVTEVERAADALIRIALERGGPDNITLVLVVHREERLPE
jgi:PPM family protein phosphatase